MNNLLLSNQTLDIDLNKKDFEVHIEIVKRNGRKCYTNITGLENVLKEENFLEDMTTKLKKKFSCGGTIIKLENRIQLNGDHRQGIKDYLVQNKIIEKEHIKVHGV